MNIILFIAIAAAITFVALMLILLVDARRTEPKVTFGPIEIVAVSDEELAALKAGQEESMRRNEALRGGE